MIGNEKDDNKVSIIVHIIHMQNNTMYFVTGEESNLKTLITSVGTRAINMAVAKKITRRVLSTSTLK